MTTPYFDAIAVIRKIREQHAEYLHTKSHAERIAFYREKARTVNTVAPEAPRTPIPQQETEKETLRRRDDVSTT